MVKALSFKGDKKSHKKRKRTDGDGKEDGQPSKQLVPATGAEEEVEEDSWVTAEEVADISGPIMLVMSSEPVTALACDQMGKVFALKVENMVEDLPDSAEPHDVRQVFVATKVVGTENEYSLKGHQGRYLGCDSLGILSTTRQAISPEETFTITPAEQASSQFTLKTKSGNHITIDADKSPPEVRGDADEQSLSTNIRIRMQARFKPRLKTEKAEKARAKISRKELEDQAGRKLEDEDIKKLKKARREGNFYEAMLDVKVKGKHDKFA